MSKVLILIFVYLFVIFTDITCLECYTGYSIIRGKTVGTETKTCTSASDKCYRANADVSTITKFKLSGCSTYRCMLSPNGCMMQAIAGQSIELCCCNSNLCNAPESNTESIAKGLLTHFTGNNNNNGGSNSNSGSSSGLLNTAKNFFTGNNGGGSNSNSGSSGGLMNNVKNFIG